MFEKFTDRARKCFALANLCAQKNDTEFVATEHLLMGILEEGSGLGALILKENPQIFVETAKFIKKGNACVVMGKLPQTLALKRAVEYAIEYAREMNHSYLGTEHLLLGLAKADGSPIQSSAAQAIKACGFTVDSILAKIKEKLNIIDSPQVKLLKDYVGQMANQSGEDLDKLADELVPARLAKTKALELFRLIDPKVSVGISRHPYDSKKQVVLKANFNHIANYKDLPNDIDGIPVIYHVVGETKAQKKFVIPPLPWKVDDIGDGKCDLVDANGKYIFAGIWHDSNKTGLLTLLKHIVWIINGHTFPIYLEEK